MNMVHISPWEATVGLFTQGAKLLPQGAPLILYGPYFTNDPPAPSNLAFDASLRGRDPGWGIRQLGDMIALAAEHDFDLDRTYPMPTNNLTLVFRRR